MAEKNSSDKKNGCRQCGTCCKKGGPALHNNDAQILEKGGIPLKSLHTLRKGELVYENIKCRIIPLHEEIIKIKSVTDSSACIFFESRFNTCGIYSDRPSECRILECWNTKPIESIYQSERLTRKQLLAKKPDWIDLIADHDQKCNYLRIIELISCFVKSPSHEIENKLNDIILFDHHIRNVLAEKNGLLTDMLDFLFGRPLTTTLRPLGVQIHRLANRIVIKVDREQLENAFKIIHSPVNPT